VLTAVPVERKTPVRERPKLEPVRAKNFFAILLGRDSKNSGRKFGQDVPKLAENPFQRHGARQMQSFYFLRRTRSSFRSITKTVHARLPCRTMRYFPADCNMTRVMTEYST
jgi:hypothetical protein